MFHSGPSHSPSRRGFKCNFRSVEGTTTTNLIEDSGSFQSPNWPQTYPVNVDLEWIIMLPDPNKRVLLTFDTPFGIAGLELLVCHKRTT